MASSHRPTGTVTFLFTDIQGSTQLWQQHAAVMPQALARHHAILRHAVEDQGGYVFQIIGDAFCAAFHTAQDGLNAAIDAQRRLRDEPWIETGPYSVRMALHSGAAELRPTILRPGNCASV
jgi:class 3 adenylate cyclase